MKKISEPHIAFLKAVFYCSVLVYAVLFAGNREGISHRSVNIFPFVQRFNEIRYFQYLGSGALLRIIANLLGNILLFAPLPAVIWQLYPKADSRSVLLTGVIVSAAIECTQYLLERGIADIDDVILNVTGCMVGILICKSVTIEDAKAEASYLFFQKSP